LLRCDIAPHAAIIPRIPNRYDDDKFVALVNGVQFQYRFKTVKSERHIGIDQGISHFAISAVDKHVEGLPKIVSARLYENLGLVGYINTPDMVIALNRERDLMSLMQLPRQDEPPNKVERVIVHVEQMSILNKNAKTFVIELARLLQRLDPDPTVCVVKLSQPNLHSRSGPAFHLGARIITELNLTPVTLTASRTMTNPAARRNQQADLNDHGEVNFSSSYRRRKQMSADVFRYIMKANTDQLTDMKIEVDEQLQNTYRQLIDNNYMVELDDLRDSLFHALRDVLCGSSSFRQTVPTTASLYNN
jgi:hypothetical protein